MLSNKGLQLLEPVGLRSAAVSGMLLQGFGGARVARALAA